MRKLRNEKRHVRITDDFNVEVLLGFNFGVQRLDYVRELKDHVNAKPNQYLLNLAAALFETPDPEKWIKDMFNGDKFNIRKINWKSEEDKIRAWQAVITAL